MEYMMHYQAWLIAGAVLILLEFFLPGLVVVFLGLGAVATAGLLYAGYIRDVIFAITFFVLISVFLLATLRRVIRKFYPSESERVETDEDQLLIGQRAETISDVTADDFSGRVKYSGTTWPAKSTTGPIGAGVRVAIVGRENISLLVRSVS